MITQVEALNVQLAALRGQNVSLQQQLAFATDDPKMSDEHLTKVVAEAVEHALKIERAHSARLAAAEAAATGTVKLEPMLVDAQATAGVPKASASHKPAVAAASGAPCSHCSSATLPPSGNVVTPVAASPPSAPGTYINVNDSMQYSTEGSYRNKPVWDQSMPTPERTARGGKWLAAAEQWTIGGPGLLRPVREYSQRHKTNSYEQRRIIGEEFVRLDCSVAKFKKHYPGVDDMTLAHICSNIGLREKARWETKWAAEKKARQAALAATLEALRAQPAPVKI